MKWIYALLIFLIFLTIPTLVVSIFAYVTPKPDKITGCFVTEMNKVYLCETSENYVTLDQVSDIAKNAILLSEDASFYSHKGFDWHEIGQSIKTNIFRMQFARGGSTITQQLAKNSFLSGKKSLGRKLQEAFIAQQIEEMMSKDDIFEKYLNVVEFGENIYGIKQASEYYFQKPPIELNALEASYLAYLLPNPKFYSRVFIDEELTEFSRKRIEDILRLLFRFKRIEDNQYKAGLSLISRFPWSNLTTEEQDLLYGTSDSYDTPLDNELFLHFGSGDVSKDDREEQ
jgi:monofunctional biosynthetic peptidoglycan transglycosylase